MKTFLALCSVCLLLLVAGAILLLLQQHRQNQTLAAVNEQLQEELATSSAAVEGLSQERELNHEIMTALEETASELNKRVESLESSAAAAQEALPKPYPVQAYIGREKVGQAWIIPHNIKRNKESGRYVFEPVLWLDESAKDHFTVHHTNVVEREVHTTQYASGYNDYPYYSYLTPGYPGGTNRPPGIPTPPIQPPTPTQPIAQQPSARARLFAPPLSIVNSRPQTLGRPATSPANARAFAP